MTDPGRPSGTDPQQSAYPAYPGGAEAPAQTPTPSGAVPRPTVVTAAMIVQIVLGALAALFGILLALAGRTIGGGDVSATELAETLGQDVSEADLQSMGTTLIGVGVVMAVLALAVIVVAVFVGKGRPWSRIAATVLLIALGLVSMSAGLLGIVALIAAVVSIVLMWLADARPYFRTAPAPR